MAGWPAWNWCVASRGATRHDPHALRPAHVTRDEPRPDEGEANAVSPGTPMDWWMVYQRTGSSAQPVDHGAAQPRVRNAAGATHAPSRGAEEAMSLSDGDARSP